MASPKGDGLSKTAQRPPSTHALIALGANLGHPQQRFKESFDALRQRGARVIGISRLYVSQAWPLDIDRGAPDYSNAVCEIVTSLAPCALLKMTTDIEHTMGRRRVTHTTHARPQDRVIDLDIIAYGDCVINAPELVVPHPRFAQRPFVVLPICDVAPTWVFAGLKQSATDVLARLEAPHHSIRSVDARWL